MDRHLKDTPPRTPVWQGVLSILGAAALTLAIPAGASSASLHARAQTQAVPAALQLPLYQALAADTTAEFKNGCTTLEAQGLTGCFNAAGARFSGADTQSLALHLTGYGRGTSLHAVTPSQPVITGNRVRYDHGDVSEWWQVLPMGFEQGFTVPKRPGGDGDLVLTLAGSQPATLEDGTLSFGRMRYGKLVVSDADGQVVPSAFKTQGKRVLIAVDDSDAAYPLTVDPLVWIEQKVAASDGAQLDLLGTSVALAGDTAVVGAYRAEIGARGLLGAAYVFTRSGGTWSQQAKLTASDGADGDRFGYRVAIDGDTAVVGTHYAAIGGDSKRGAAYVFTRTAGSWSQQAKLTASDGAEDDNFGRSVAVDGDTAVAGAPIAKVGVNIQQGAAYVFTRAAGAWSEQAKLTASDGGRVDHFGNSIAIAGDTVVVGAPTNGPGLGAAYVFTRAASAWSEQAKLMASDGANGYFFGGSVSVVQDTALIGSQYAEVNGNDKQGAAYVFSRAGNAWSQQAKLTADDGAEDDRFGESATLAGDTAVIGAAPNNREGAAYAFTRAGGTWSQSRKITASDGGPVGSFGSSVAHAEGTTLIGAPNATVDANRFQGAVYFYGATDLDFAVNAPGTVGENDNYTSQAIATNNANDDSPALTALIPIPASTNFVSANATQGNCSEASGTVTCAFGAIAGNAGRATANVTLKATGNAGTTLDNSARIARATPELSASVNTTVNAGGGGGAGSGNASAPDSVGGGGGCTLAATPGAPDPTLPLLGLLAALTLYRRRASAWLQRRQR